MQALHVGDVLSRRFAVLEMQGPQGCVAYDLVDLCRVRLTVLAKVTTAAAVGDIVGRFALVDVDVEHCLVGRAFVAFDLVSRQRVTAHALTDASGELLVVIDNAAESAERAECGTASVACSAAEQGAEEMLTAAWFAQGELEAETLDEILGLAPDTLRRYALG